LAEEIDDDDDDEEVEPEEVLNTTETADKSSFGRMPRFIVSDRNLLGFAVSKKY
jgi:hypothetical protein